MLLKSQTQIVLNSRALVLLHILVWSLPDTLTMSSGTPSDITCLKSIRDSLEDPLNHIATSWTFNNLTESPICGYDGVSCTTENRVRGVQLANMGLKGKFPRGLVDCSALIILDLTGNGISGSIPPDISEILPAVEVLKLSNNNLSGEIPSSMGNCSNLKVLILDNNRLTGQIPQQLNQLIHLEAFSVANNLLSGPVPDFVSVTTIKPESYVNNSGLCGGPLEYCRKKHSWSFEISFRSGFVVGFVVFAFSYTAFFTYYFNLCVGSNKRNKIMPTNTTELTATRTNIAEKVDQVTQLMKDLISWSFGKSNRCQEDDYQQSPAEENRLKRRGPTKLAEIWALDGSWKIRLTLNGQGQPIGPDGKTFVRWLGTFLHNGLLCPLVPAGWPNVREKVKEDCWVEIKKRYLIPSNIVKPPNQMGWAMHILGVLRRNRRSKLKKDHIKEGMTKEEVLAKRTPPRVMEDQWKEMVNYWFHEKTVTLSDKNKASRGKQKEIATSGAQSFAQIADDMAKANGAPVERADVYLKVYRRRDGTAVTPRAQENISRMEELLSQAKVHVIQICLRVAVLDGDSPWE
nr:putative inactive leucine-rich repeat receptor-like protein kinase [Quercus suber]